MESEFVLGAQETRAYLARLGLERPERPTREALADLVYAHQCSIPFETIDMYRCTEPTWSRPMCSTSWSRSAAAATASS